MHPWLKAIAAVLRTVTANTTAAWLKRTKRSKQTMCGAAFARPVQPLEHVSWLANAVHIWGPTSLSVSNLKHPPRASGVAAGVANGDMGEQLFFAGRAALGGTGASAALGWRLGGSCAGRG
jgi:hypothetical protein